LFTGASTPRGRMVNVQRSKAVDEKASLGFWRNADSKMKLQWDSSGTIKELRTWAIMSYLPFLAHSGIYRWTILNLFPNAKREF
jgi:hypothetical protein